MFQLLHRFLLSRAYLAQSRLFRSLSQPCREFPGEFLELGNVGAGAPNSHFEPPDRIAYVLKGRSNAEAY